MAEDSFTVNNLPEFKALLRKARRECPAVIERILESLGEVLLGQAKEVLRSDRRPHARYKKMTRTVSRGVNAGKKRNYLQYVGSKDTNAVDKGMLWNSLSRGLSGNIWTYSAQSKTLSLKVGSAVSYAGLINDGYSTRTAHWVPGTVDSKGIFRHQKWASSGVYVKARTYKGVLFFDIGFKELERLAPGMIRAELIRFAEDFNHAT